MNPKVVLAVATLAAVCGAGHAIFLTTGGAIAGASTVGLTGGGAAALALGGLAVLKVAAIAGLALASRGRGKRSTEVEDAPFALIAQVEPAQCYRRLICDLATGRLPKSDNDVILSLFKDDVSVENPKFEFATAAKVGQLTKDIDACEVRYSCPLKGQQINALLAN